MLIQTKREKFEEALSELEITVKRKARINRTQARAYLLWSQKVAEAFDSSCEMLEKRIGRFASNYEWFDLDEIGKCEEGWLYRKIELYHLRELAQAVKESCKNSQRSAGKVESCSRTVSALRRKKSIILKAQKEAEDFFNQSVEKAFVEATDFIDKELNYVEGSARAWLGDKGMKDLEMGFFYQCEVNRYLDDLLEAREN